MKRLLYCGINDYSGKLLTITIIQTWIKWHFRGIPWSLNPLFGDQPGAFVPHGSSIPPCYHPSITSWAKKTKNETKKIHVFSSLNWDLLNLLRWNISHCNNFGRFKKKVASLHPPPCQHQDLHQYVPQLRDLSMDIYLLSIHLELWKPHTFLGVKLGSLEVDQFWQRNIPYIILHRNLKNDERLEIDSLFLLMSKYQISVRLHVVFLCSFFRLQNRLPKHFSSWA